MLGQLVVPCALPPHTRSWLRKKRTWIQNPFSNPKKVGVAFSGLFAVENINPGPELYLYSSSAFWFPLLSASVPSPARCQYETQGLIGATFIDAHIQPPKTKRIAMQLFNRFFVDLAHLMWSKAGSGTPMLMPPLRLSEQEQKALVADGIHALSLLPKVPKV